MSGLKVVRLGGRLGAVVGGVDLRDPKDAEVALVREALLEHEVLFFRNAALDDDAHLRLAACFGRPSVFPLSKLLGVHEPTFQVIRDDEQSRPAADNWHTDVTWTSEPPAMGFLRATIVPDIGGDTMWGSMTAAYDALSPAMQVLLDGFRVVHDNASFAVGVRAKLGDELTLKLRIEERLRDEYPPVEHPLVRTHPETGKRALLIGGNFMRRVVGLSSLESDRILAFVQRHIEQPHFHCRWRWQPGDVAIWDERATVHRALGDHYPKLREVRRCTIDGERPSPVAA